MKTDDSNLWRAKGIWLKGNIHTHSVNSDGALKTGEIATEYGRKNYDFVFLTDHNKFTVPEKPGRKPFLIPAEEISFGQYHFVCLGLKREWSPKSFRTPAELLNRARREGVFVVIAHPYWCGNSTQACIFSGHRACPGMEIYNGVCDWLNGKGYSLVQWDDLLDAGHRISGFAVDDMHGPSHIAQGWIMVKARERTPAAVLAAIRQGSFYSSQGPVIKSISIRRRKLTVSCSPAKRVNFIRNRSGGSCRFASKTLFTKAFYDFPRAACGYVRVEVVDAAGKIAWSNPIFFPR